MNTVTVLAIAATAFVTTNLDDLFILVGFMSAPSYRTRDVILGRCLGAVGMTLLCYVLALTSFAVAPAYFGLLGVMPVIIGIRRLHKSAATAGQGQGTRPTLERDGFRTAALATIGGFGDNVGVYVPLFAAQGAGDVALTMTVFATMTGLWCLLAYWLVNNHAVGQWLRLAGQWLLPWMLIAIGFTIIGHAGTVALLISAWPLVILLGVAIVSHAVTFTLPLPSRHTIESISPAGVRQDIHRF